MLEDEGPDQKAIRLLNRQLGELQTVRSLSHTRPQFKAWRDSTSEILRRFLGPDSHHTVRFRDTRFFGPTRIRPWGSQPLPDDYVSKEDRHAFQTGCEAAEASLRAAVKHVEDFGVYLEESKPAGRKRDKIGGGVNQSFHGPVSLNQAIATGSAVQKVSHIGNKTGVDLKEISDLLQQSQDLSPNQVRQGVAEVEALAVEAEKPEEKRNWKAVLDYGQKVLDVAGKAADLGTKLAPHLRTVVTLMENARHFLK